MEDVFLVQLQDCVCVCGRGSFPRSHGPVKSLSVIYHICQTKPGTIIEGDLNLRAPQFARPLIPVKRWNISVAPPKDGQDLVARGANKDSMCESKIVMPVTLL